MPPDTVPSTPLLARFLSDPASSGHRERMFRHRLLFDVHEAFARANAKVQVYDTEVDVAGFDVILDSLTSIRRFQLKTVASNAKTSVWKIHRYLLAPNIHILNHTPFASDSGGIGYMGGVILTVIEASERTVKIRYFYTDAFVIAAMQLGIFRPRHPNHARAVEAVFKLMTAPTYHKVLIKLRRCCFWEMSNIDSLLKVAGFHLQGDAVSETLRESVAYLCGRPRGVRFDSPRIAIRHAEGELRQHVVS